MYKSPIEIITDEIITSYEDEVIKAVQSHEVNCDKEELLRALQYDRDQYRKGYEDGKTDAVRHGQWITCTSSDHWKCSECGYRAPMWWNGDEDGYIEWLSDYCPNCGAKMDERKE